MLTSKLGIIPSTRHANENGGLISFTSEEIEAAANEQGRESRGGKRARANEPGGKF